MILNVVRTEWWQGVKKESSRFSLTWESRTPTQRIGRRHMVRSTFLVDLVIGNVLQGSTPLRRSVKKSTILTFKAGLERRLKRQRGEECSGRFNSRPSFNFPMMNIDPLYNARAPLYVPRFSWLSQSSVSLTWLSWLVVLTFTTLILMSIWKLFASKEAPLP